MKNLNFQELITNVKLKNLKTEMMTMNESYKKFYKKFAGRTVKVSPMVQSLMDALQGKRDDIKTADDWFTVEDIKPEDRTDFAFAAALDNVKKAIAYSEQQQAYYDWRTSLTIEQKEEYLYNAWTNIRGEPYVSENQTIEH